MAYKRPGPQRPNKLDWGVLRRHVEPPLIGRKQNGLGISRSPDIASGTHCENWRCPIKRRRCHERDPLQRKRFLRRSKQPVYIDECGFVSSSTRRYGDAPKGQRVDGLVSGHRRPCTSLIAARIDGRLEEPYLFDGTCDTALCNAWLKTRLCPRLNAQHLVIMDNSAAHRPNRRNPAVPRALFPRSEPH